MLAFCLKLVSLPIIITLLLFNLRRILFTLSILPLTQRVFLARRAPLSVASDDELPSVLILVPCRDEEALMDGLGRALAQLDYSQDKLQIVLIDDGSRDATRAEMERIARAVPNVHVCSIGDNVGKARALNFALARFSFGEIVYIFDADHRPRADALKRAMRYFHEPKVAGVSGRTIPSNALASPSAYYSTVESYVHQMVTMRAKDWLDLAPALLGSNCSYRRSALNAVGGFRPGAFLEDSDLTLRLCRTGYRLRFAEDAVAYYQVPETVTGYLKQHARWGRGFNDVARDQAVALVRAKNLNPLLRAELVLFALGYFDRLALLASGLLAVLSMFNFRSYKFPRAVLYLALLTPFAQIVALFVEQRVSVAMWLRLPFVPIFFALDIYAATRGMLNSISNRKRVWERTERAASYQRLRDA